MAFSVQLAAEFTSAAAPLTVLQAGNRQRAADQHNRQKLPNHGRSSVKHVERP